MSRSNPFSVRFVQPGVLEWMASDEGMQVSVLRDRLIADCQSRGAILGPHGAGKSTLVHHLLSGWGGPFARLQLRRRESPWGRVRQVLPGMGRGQLLVLDGFEQLSPLARIHVRWSTRRRGVGLLVTSHRTCGVTVLARVEPGPELVWRLVRNRLDAAGVALSGEAMRDLEHRTGRLLRVHGGNVREVFMALYDWFEEHAIGGGQG